MPISINQSKKLIINEFYFFFATKKISPTIQIIKKTGPKKFKYE